MHSTAARLALPALALLAPTWTTLAGPLNPPAGPVTSSFKTLTEVEPRTAINTANTPGDADSQFKITAPGSYYLTGNIQGVAGKSGIKITTNGVTVDLCGFSLLGTVTSLDGIAVSGFRSDIAVRNGSARGWGGTGVNLSSASQAQARDLRAIGNSAGGISVGADSVVTACSTSQNLYGVAASIDCSVTGCTSRDDTYQGIIANSGSTVRDCAAWGVTNASGTGIYADIGCTVIGCTARACAGNGIRVDDGAVVQGCSATSNNGYGIFSVRSATVLDCNSSGNLLDGIRVKDNSLVRGNTTSFNGLGPTSGSGILILGFNNRVESNTSSQNDHGIDVQSAGNFIHRNTCRGNGSNFVIVAGNACYAVSANISGAINGSNGGTSFGSSDPNANFSY